MNFFKKGIDFSRIIPCFQEFIEKKDKKLRVRNYCGLIKTEYDFSNIKGKYYKFYVLGFCLFFYDIGPEGKFLYIFRKKVKELSPNYSNLFYILKDYVEYKLNIKSFNPVITFCYTGELNHLCHFIHALDDINRLKNKVFIFYQSSNIQVLKMYKIKDPGVVVPEFFKRLGFCEQRHFLYKDATECYKFIDYQFFHHWDYLRTNFKTPIIDCLNDYYSLHKITPVSAPIPEEDKSFIEEYVSRTIGNSPFIIINSDTTCGCENNSYLWKKLIKTLQAKGYKCLLNADDDEEYTDVCEQCFFDYTKTRYLASLAYASIGTRSGFTAIISEDCKKLISFVRTIGRVNGECALAYWPLAKNFNAQDKEIHEINAEFLTDDQLISEIVSRL